MTQARRQQISLEDTLYYHCISRCVRRAFLCGEDHYSGQSFEHRRQWVVDRLRQLTNVFAIDCCAFSIMSNHFHVILRVDVEQAKSWDAETVIHRWHQLFRTTLLSERFLKGETLCNAELDALMERVETWRERLMSISWFMRELNQFIAREANQEDRCKGRFWESRFKSQALLDTTALLACMAYVDLNPIRANIADSLQSSDFTSIQERLYDVANACSQSSDTNATPTERTKLLPFVEAEHQHAPSKALPFNLKDYIDLVDQTGRAIRADKSGFITDDKPKLLDKLGLTPEQWQLLAINIQKQSLAALGSLGQLEIYHATINKRWMPRQEYLQYCYSSA